jgi:hypothetical protein
LIEKLVDKIDTILDPLDTKEGGVGLPLMSREINSGAAAPVCL